MSSERQQVVMVLNREDAEYVNELLTKGWSVSFSEGSGMGWMVHLYVPRTHEEQAAEMKKAVEAGAGIHLRNKSS